MKLQLPDVTLVAIDTVCHETTALAIKECLDKAQFGGIHIYTDDPIPFARLGIDGMLGIVEPLKSLNEVMAHLWYRAPEHIETSHALTINGTVESSVRHSGATSFSAATMWAPRGAGTATHTKSATAASRCARAA